MEQSLTSLKDKIVEGKYFDNNGGLIIGEGVKKIMKVNIGDSLTLISQGYHGVNAAGMYPVIGIAHFTSPDLNKSMIYMTLKDAEYFYDADNLVTSIALKIKNKNDLKEIKEELVSKLDTAQYAVLDWKELLPDLVKAKEADTAGNYIFIVVLYALIAFGIFGTILMMAKEREYEFGVLISIGMKRKLLAFVVWLEILILGIVGALAGIIGSIPLVYYFHANPIDFSGYDKQLGGAFEKWGFDPIIPTVFDMNIFYGQGLIVVVLTSILSFYAIYKIFTIKPVEAMRS
ncbi:MAG: FtsX-like permease family protein [Saprospiraceae bacterium]